MAQDGSAEDAAYGIDNPSIDSPGSNAHEYSVGEIAFAVKRTIEEEFGRVRVRGEVSRPKRAASGHLYLTLKDDKAVLDAVAWRGVAGRLSIQPEEGMEVICTGRLSTFPGNSRYQLIIEQVELAGEGALLKLLEERRKRLAAEGLFDEDRKRPLPYLPEVIGVVTSPTGAVIRDILHRLEDRFPRHVLLWPVVVQGEAAAGQIAAAIDGFNALKAGGPIPRPDVLIVGRGGGSLEDLMAFNEEMVVRAAARSEIPLISAVGHETDTTLIDFVSDRRAPTPTAAAEMAVPVRADLIADLMDRERRLYAGANRAFGERETRVQGLARGLGDPARLIEYSLQRLDDRVGRWDRAIRDRLARLGERLASQRPRHPADRLDQQTRALGIAWERLAAGTRTNLSGTQRAFKGTAARLSAETIERKSANAARDLTRLEARLAVPMPRRLADASAALAGLEQMLNSLSYERVLDRGFAILRDADGRPLPQSAGIKPGAALSVQMRDGALPVTARGRADGGTKIKKPKPDAGARQETLF